MAIIPTILHHITNNTETFKKTNSLTIIIQKKLFTLYIET